MEQSAEDRRRRRMVDRQLRGRGVTDERVLEVLARVPREAFLPPEHAHLAFEDRAVPVGEGQTISQPYMVGVMTQALDLGPGQRVLEIGTGSGYQTAVLAELADEVFTVERIPSLAERARHVLEGLGYRNVRYRVGDGSLGWPEEAPFDAILVTAGAPEIPPALLDQLSADGGRLVIPVGSRTLQELHRCERHGTELTRQHLVSCRFVPLVGREGWGDGIPS